MKKAILALSVAGMLVTSTAFATNGYFGHGYSTKEKGLAGAGVAYSQDSLASATNPAGLVNVGNRFDIGIALFSPNREYEVTGDPMAAAMGGGFPLGNGNYSSDNNAFAIPNIGISFAIDDKSAWGIAAYGNGGMNTEYNGVPTPFAMFPPEMGGNPNATGTFAGGTAGVNLMQLFVNLSYAYQVNDSNAVGVGLIGAAQSFEAKGLDTFGNFGYSTSPENLSNNGSDRSYGAGVKLGWQGQATKALTIGASYQSEIWMSEFDNYSGLFADGGDFDIPATATVGIAWNTSPNTVLVLDVQRIYYSNVKALNNGVENLQLADGTGRLGGSNGAGFGWEDMTIVKLGYEFGQNVKWRVGASYGEQPISNGQNMFNILAPAVITTHYTGGVTVPFGENSEFIAAVMYAPSNTVSGTVSPGQSVDLTMDQSEVQVGYALNF